MERRPVVRNTRPAASVSPVGRLLKQWRGRRRLSQLALATEAGISPRHLSFIETGRAQPSRALLALLGQVPRDAATAPNTPTQALRPPATRA